MLRGSRPGRADDYYLTEGTGPARRFTATDGRVTELAPLTGEAYETWVAGHDPATGEPCGRLRTDAHAVRFVEVVVNGPKTWSLAAALQPDIAAAYEAAQRPPTHHRTPRTSSRVERVITARGSWDGASDLSLKSRRPLSGSAVPGRKWRAATR